VKLSQFCPQQLYRFFFCANAQFHMHHSKVPTTSSNTFFLAHSRVNFYWLLFIKYSEFFGRVTRSYRHPSRISDCPNSPKTPQRTDGVVNLFKGINFVFELKSVWPHSTPIVPSCQHADGQSLLQSNRCLLQQSSLYMRTGCVETSVRSYHLTLRYVAEGRRLYLNCI
jgi:hypothetical protein